MKKLEVIKLLLEEKCNYDIVNLLKNNEVYNLTLLCYLNKKYLTKETFNVILKEKPVSIRYLLNDRSEYQNDNLSYYYSSITLLVSKYPNLYNKLDEKIKFTIDDWVKLIQEQPKLFNKCKISYRLDSYNWANIIRKQAKLINKCNIDKFNKDNWIVILKEQPQLASNYKKLYKEIDEFSALELLRSNNNIVNYIDFSKIDFSEDTVLDVLLLCPKLIEKIDKNKMSTLDWVHFIGYNPKLIDQCPVRDKFNINEIVNLICMQPEFVYMLPTIDEIENKHLRSLVINRIEFIEELNINLKNFNVNDWFELLKRHPSLIDKCDKIKEMHSSNWSKILQKQPQLIKYCDKIDNFNEDDWHGLLFYQPQFIDKCNIDMSVYLREVLIENNFDLIDKIKNDDIESYYFEKIVYKSGEYRNKVVDKYTEKFHDEMLLTNMIGIYPDLKDLYTKKDLWKYVDFNQLTDNLEYTILK